MKKLMGNKGGWLRIAEAFIAILLITGVLLVIYTRTGGRGRSSESIYKLQKTILEETASNPDLRGDILEGRSKRVSDFIASRIPKIFEFEIRICELNDICSLENYEEGREVYASERIITSTFQKYGPKKLKLFMWRAT